MEAVGLRPRAEVVEVVDREGFAALRPEWNALSRQTDDQLFYRHEFVSAYFNHFATDERLRVLTLREDGALTAILPLVESRTTMYGLPVVMLASASNTHSCRFDLIAGDAQAAAQHFLDHLQADDRWDVIRLHDVPEGGKAWALIDLAQRRGLPTGAWESLQSPYITLPASYAELEATLRSDFRSNLRRRRRRLKELGEVVVERHSSPETLDERLREGFEVERSGWKGKAGTAIAQDPKTLGFYTEVARFAASEGALRLYFMRLNGKPIAFDYAISYGGRYSTHKAGYDESYHRCSPGQLLSEDSVRACIEEGLTEYDLLGDSIDAKLDWTRRVRRHAWLFTFRDSALGRALRAAKFAWARTAKEMVGRLTG